MTHQRQAITVLFAEDDHDDCLLVGEAFQVCVPGCDLAYVHDGLELLHYLRQGVGVVTFTEPPRPDLILLDLNMPRKDGREALAEIKSDPRLRYIPVVVLTTSKAEEDIMRSYDIGAASYITKPVTFDGLVEAIRQLKQYWVQIVRLPITDPVRE